MRYTFRKTKMEHRLDNYEFAAKMTESLAWPLVAIVAILVFRGDVQRGIARLLKLEAFGVSAEFSELQRLEQDVSELVEPDAAQAGARGSAQFNRAEDGSPPVVHDGVNEPTQHSPAAIIVNEWDSFQNFAFGVFKKIVDSVPEVFLVSDMFDQMAKKGLLSPEQAKGVKSAIRVRNKILDGEHVPTTSEAIRYKNALNTLRAYVEMSLHGN